MQTVKTYQKLQKQTNKKNYPTSFRTNETVCSCCNLDSGELALTTIDLNYALG